MKFKPAVVVRSFLSQKRVSTKVYLLSLISDISQIKALDDINRPEAEVCVTYSGPIRTFSIMGSNQLRVHGT